MEEWDVNSDDVQVWLEQIMSVATTGKLNL